MAAFWMWLLFVLTGCTSVKVDSKVDKRIAYKKVYFNSSKGNDPIHMEPMVIASLKKAGFAVTVTKHDELAKERQGSGFLLTTNGQMLTCAHVVEGQEDVTAWVNGKRYVGKVRILDTNLDVALVQLDGFQNGPSPLPVSREMKYRLGQDVYTMGFPLADELGVSPRLSKGLVSATVGMKDDPKHIQISAQVQPGSSGAPLLNEHGEVIGMVNATINPLMVLMKTGDTLPQNINFAINAQCISDFLTQSHVEFARAANSDGSGSLDVAKDSVVLVRSGIVTDEELKAPALACAAPYLYQPDPLFPSQLVAISINFIDMQSGKKVLTVTGARKNIYASRQALMDEMFEKICDELLPNQPNPFKKK